MIQISRPQPLWKRVFQEAAIYEIGGAILASGLGILSAQRFFTSNPPEHFLGWLSTALVGGVLFMAVGKVITQLRSKNHVQNPHELTGCLHTLHAILTTSLQENETDPCLRITVHMVVDGGNSIEQLMDYVGDDRGQGGAGRHFRASCGITGKAIKNNSFVVAKRRNDDYSLYLKELLDSHDYREDEAKRLNPATMSWAAMPLMNEQKLVAVIYCDATVRDFFSAERQLLIQGAGAGIARFVAQRYTKA